jgi:hypothetical protein
MLYDQIIQVKRRPAKCADAAEIVVNTPVDSTTYSAPADAQAMAWGNNKECAMQVWTLRLGFLIFKSSQTKAQGLCL